MTLLILNQDNKNSENCNVTLEVSIENILIFISKIMFNSKIKFLQDLQLSKAYGIGSYTNTGKGHFIANIASQFIGKNKEVYVLVTDELEIDVIERMAKCSLGKDEVSKEEFAQIAGNSENIKIIQVAGKTIKQIKKLIPQGEKTYIFIDDIDDLMITEDSYGIELKTKAKKADLLSEIAKETGNCIVFTFQINHYRFQTEEAYSMLSHCEEILLLERDGQVDGVGTDWDMFVVTGNSLYLKRFTQKEKIPASMEILDIQDGFKLDLFE